MKTKKIITVQNVPICPDCDGELECYYGMKCFHCEKHKPNSDPKAGKLNLIESMYYVKNNEPEFDYNTMWTELCNNNTVYGNDTTCMLGDYESKMLDIFKKHYPVNTSYFVSW